MKFYIDFDTRLKKYFIAPFQQDKKLRYLIVFSKRHEAESFLRKLVLNQIKSPTEKVELYDEIKSDAKTEGELKIYTPKNENY